jgi:hypothetical protein
MLFKKVWVFVLISALFSVMPASAQDQGKPFIMPVALQAGPSSWLLGQPYGNTTGAYNFGSLWYEAGQGLHFGIDLSMPCGTPLVAVANAEVMGVDDLGFGSAPHNLILRHAESGLTTLYGHLLERPPLVNGQFVEQGQIIALSGDPDSTCDSRPHLHFEVRSLDYRTAYNPVDYINAAWHSLSNIGSFSSQNFQRDLYNPRQWLTLDDQPPVAFGGRILNTYAATWPPPDQPPPNPLLAREALPIPGDFTWQQRRIGYEGCCFWPWWHPSDSNRLYTIDGTAGQIAGRYEWAIGSEASFNLLGEAPQAFISPDGTHEVRLVGDQSSIRRLSDNVEWTVMTDGAVPAINPDNTRLMWVIRRGVSVPGQEPPPLEVWISDMSGENRQQIASQRGGSAVWVDANRLLLSSSERQVTTVSLYNITDSSTSILGSWTRLRGLSIAPGGSRMMFFIAYNTEVETNGVYVMDIQPGAAAVKLPWFGAWRWRDADSVYYVPFDPTTNEQSLAYYHIPTGEQRQLTDPSTTPFSIANGDWSVSADGKRIVFLSAVDRIMWLLEDSNNP